MSDKFYFIAQVNEKMPLFCNQNARTWTKFTHTHTHI